MAASVEVESERWCIVLVVVERDGSLVLVVEPTHAQLPCPQCGELSRRHIVGTSGIRLISRGAARWCEGVSIAVGGPAVRQPVQGGSSLTDSTALWLGTLVARTT
jgi:hypothetical protein